MGVVATGAMCYLATRAYQQWQASPQGSTAQPPEPDEASVVTSEAAAVDHATTATEARPLPAQKPGAALDSHQLPQAASTTEPAGRTRSVVALVLAAALASALAYPWLQKVGQGRQQRASQAAPTP